MEFTNVTDGELTWRLHDAGDGQAVVLLHGFPDTPHSYANIARALNVAGYRTIVPYLRGYHGDTIVDDRPYDTVTLAEDALRMMDALGVRSAVLVGHDWGATVVYAAAALAPDRVDGIVSIAIPHPATLKPKNALEALTLLVLARHFLYFKTPWAEAGTRRRDFAYIEQIYRRWAPGWQGPERDAAVARIKEHFADPRVLTGAIDYYRALGTKVDPRLKGTLKVRALMVGGADDFGGRIGPYKKSQGKFEPPAELMWVEGAGHWPHREREPEFIDSLLTFLGSLR